MSRKKLQPVNPQDARTIGGLLRSLRRSAGFRAAADAAGHPGCPAARQTIYAYERGGLVPSLKQFLELVEFYALSARGENDRKDPEEIKAEAVAAVASVLTLRAYHFTEAMALIGRLRFDAAPDRNSGRHQGSENE